MRLKSRQLFIPNGFQFYLPQLKWSAPRMVSFDRICDELSRVVAANPALAAKHKWPTDRRGIEDWVDLYNATLCARMGWDNYIFQDTGESIPKMSAPHQQEMLQSLRNAAGVAKALVQGAKTLSEWVESGAEAVTPELSTHRAIVCSMCPKNSMDDLTKWFTVPAAALIKRLVQKAQDRKLTTPRDDMLNICTVCHCPMKLKVHVPIDWIGKRMDEKEKEDLKQGKSCWILEELERK